MDPWPGAFTTWNGATLKVLRSVALPGGEAPQGTVVATDGPATLGVVTGDGVLGVLDLQLEGRRPNDAESFLRGRPDLLGALLPS